MNLNYTNLMIKKTSPDYIYYNDLLSIKHDILLFENDTNFQNKRTEAINILESILEIDNKEISNKIKFECSYLYFLQGNFNKSLDIANSITNDSSFNESSILLRAEIYDYKIKNKSMAANLYLDFLDDFPLSIHYESVRLRLRELAG